MDQCFGLTCSLKTEDLLDVKIPQQISTESVLKFLSILFTYETAFLDGASLLESTHKCVFLWEESWLKDRFSTPLEKCMVNYCRSLNKSLSHLNSGILAADIYEGDLPFWHKLMHFEFPTLNL